MLANKSIEKIPDPCNAKEHYQSFIKKGKKNKVSKTIRNNYLSTKKFWKPNIVDIKSSITEHSKTSHKLSKTIRQAEKVSSDSFLYSDAKKVKNL